MDKYLSVKASQVLIAALLVRKVEAQLGQAEFAIRAGISGVSLPGALLDLGQAGLIQSIPQEVKAHVEAPIELVGSSSFVSILPDTLQTHDQGGIGVGDRGAGAHTPGADQNGKLKPPVVLRGVEDTAAKSPLDLCREADESGRRPDQVRALQAAWDVAFPVDEYEYQRLQPYAAKKFLVGRSAEEIGEVILEAPTRAKERIGSP